MDRLSDEAINELTPEERLELIERLWDSLNDVDVPVTPAQRTELRRRMKDTEPGIPWEQVKAELQRRQR
jgi:putative addiction module component (TIGR02574 family)